MTNWITVLYEYLATTVQLLWYNEYTNESKKNYIIFQLYYIKQTNKMEYIIYDSFPEMSDKLDILKFTSLIQAPYLNTFNSFCSL